MLLPVLEIWSFFHWLSAPGSRFTNLFYRFLLLLPLKRPDSRFPRAIFRGFLPGAVFIDLFYRLLLQVRIFTGSRLLGAVFKNLFYRLLLRFPLKRPGWRLLRFFFCFCFLLYPALTPSEKARLLGTGFIDLFYWLRLPLKGIDPVSPTLVSTLHWTRRGRGIFI